MSFLPLFTYYAPIDARTYRAETIEVSAKSSTRETSRPTGKTRDRLIR